MLNRSRRFFDIAVPTIVLINVLIYCIYRYNPQTAEFFDANFVANWDALHDRRLWTLVTSLFFHKDYLHLLATTCGLVTFGFMLENKIGSIWFMEYYLACGALSAFNHCMLSPLIGSPSTNLFGATAPLTGVVVLITLIERNRPLKVFKFPLIEPAWFAGLLVGIDLMGILGRGSAAINSPIGHGGNIAAAVVATVYYHKIMRHRVWRHLQTIAHGQDLVEVKIMKLGWVLPCRDEDQLDNMAVFFKDIFALKVADQGEPATDTKIQRFTKFKTPWGSINLVEPNKMRNSGLYSTPMLSITVDNLASACKNLDSRKVEMVAPMFTAGGTWAFVYYKAPDGRIYEIKGPYGT